MPQSAAVMQAAQVRAIALNLDWNKIKDLVDQYGPVILDFAERLMSGGLSASLVIDLITKLFVPIWDMIQEWLGTSHTLMAQFAVTPGIPGNLGGIMLPWFLKKFGLPLLKALVPDQFKPLVDQYGQQIIDVIIQLLQGSSGTQALIPVLPVTP